MTPGALLASSGAPTVEATGLPTVEAAGLQNKEKRHA